MVKFSPQPFYPTGKNPDSMWVPPPVPRLSEFWWREKYFASPELEPWTFKPLTLSIEQLRYPGSSRNEFFFRPVTLRSNADPWPPQSPGFQITHTDAPHSVWLPWTGDQAVAKTSTWQHTTFNIDKHPCPRRDSNAQSQQASGCRPTP